MPHRDAPHLDQVARLILVEQVEAMGKNLLMSIPASCALSVVIAFRVKDAIAHTTLATWLIGIFFTNMIRYVVIFFTKSLLHSNPRGIAFTHIAFAAISGVLWAVAPAIMMISNGTPDPYVITILAGITAASTVQAASFALGGQAFVFPILAAIIIRFVLEGGQSNYAAAGTMVLYLMFLVRSGSKTEETFKRTVLLKIDATALAESLEREHKTSIVANERLFQLANNDSLTGLANRASFAAKLQTWLDKAGASSSTFSLFLLDLDHFKSINDTLGHSAGDTVLQNVATRISTALSSDDVVARLGGDEFAIIVADTEVGEAGDRDAHSIAEQLIEKVSGRFFVGECPVRVGVSIGIATFPDDGTTAEALLAHADLALYAAKNAGRQQSRRFDERLLATVTMALDIEHDLTGAMADGSLEVWFQPQLALDDLRLIGLEALLRWNHPVQGWIAPPRIVAAALRGRISEALTGYVLAKACREIQNLDDAGLCDVTVAVNVSPSEVDQYILSELVQRSIVAHAVDPRRLEIEITEEAFAAAEKTLACFTAMTQIGVHLAIDDFGTGYSSIAYLGRMRVNRIKIDRGFVSGFNDRPGDRIIVQAILGLGRSFGIEVLAEGVETEQEAVLLRAFGCHVAQGYHFGRPMPSPDLKAWIAVHTERQALGPTRALLTRKAG